VQAAGEVFRREAALLSGDVAAREQGAAALKAAGEQLSEERQLAARLLCSLMSMSAATGKALLFNAAKKLQGSEVREAGSCAWAGWWVRWDGLACWLWRGADTVASQDHIPATQHSVLPADDSWFTHVAAQVQSHQQFEC